MLQVGAMARELYCDPYVHITCDDVARLIRLTRSSEPFPTIAALDATYGRLRALLDPRMKAMHKLLFDTRAGPARNDEAFELAMRRNRDVHEGFARVAMLARTAVGKLHIRRIAQDAQRDAPRIFQDEAEALRWLQS